MAYIVKVDIIEQFPEEDLIALTDDEGGGMQVDSRVTAAITKAESEIDAYLSIKYTVPLSPVPEVVKGFAVDIAICHLYSRRSTPPEVRKDRYNAAIAFLEKVAEGIVSLGDAAPAPGSSTHGVNITSNDRVFKRDDMKSF